MLAARMLRSKEDQRHGRFYEFTERAFNGIINFYGDTLRVVLRVQPLILARRPRHARAHPLSLHRHSQGASSPIQDTGQIQGISEADQSISFPAMADRQQALANAILQDDAVESISSFIGVDGTNVTLNDGRIQINLKPLAQRHLSGQSTLITPACSNELANIQGITLFMQPVQDLTVDDTR